MQDITQSDTKQGVLSLLCAADLTGKEGLLVELVSTGAQLPNANTDITPFICVGGDIANNRGQFLPLSSVGNARVIAKGAGSRGDQLVLADVATAADKGKLRAIPATTGTYRVYGIAEEDFVDGQLVKFRPYPVGNVTIP